MKLKDFELIANYLNEINRHTFTDVEVKQSAKDYLVEYKANKKNGLSTNVMKSLDIKKICGIYKGVMKWN